jgi:DNA-binding NtrC family response regulator
LTAASTRYCGPEEAVVSLVKVLLVDDERPFVEAMSKRLVKRGLAVVQAYSAQDGLDKLRDDKDIDIVVLDVAMPGMNGIQALKEIKSARPLVEVILLSGYATVESAIEGMKMGAHDFLIKPCDIEILVSKIAEAEEDKIAHEEKILEARMRQITLASGG